MKVSFPFFTLGLLGVLTSCQSNYSNCDEVVCDTVHRYGVSLEPEDWSNRGQHGQIISMRKDGVCVTRSYDAGILHGDCTYTFPYRETIEKREIYNQGNLGEEVFYYHHGLPCKQVTHNSSTAQSTVSWYESGAPQSREEFENGFLTRGEYFNLNQQLDSRVENSQGLKTCRDRFGQMESVDMIQGGQLVLRTHYHPNGNPSVVAPYVDGVLQGERRTYQPGGEPATIEEWNNGIQEGNTIVYEYGERRADVPYMNGHIHGVEHRYRDGQELVQDINWIQGQKHGPCYTYAGTTPQVDWYFRDRKVANKSTYEMLSNQ